MSRRRVVPELQVTPLESGLCCAAMLLHLHGSSQPTAQLREELDLGRGGSTFPELAELFTKRGIPAEPVQADSDTAAAIEGTFIAAWANAGFVLVERVGPKWVTVVDPAIGRRQAPRSEFDEAYAGWYLKPDFDGGRLVDTVSQRPYPTPFRTAMRASAGPLVGVTIMSLVVYATDIGAPYLTQLVIDHSFKHPEKNQLGSFIPWVLLICLAVGVGVFCRSYFIARSAVRIGRDTSESVLDHLLGLPFRYFDSRQPGELAYRMAGLSAIRDSLSDQLFTGFFQIGGLVAYLGFLYYQNVTLGLIATGFVAAMLGVLFGSRHLFYSAIQNELSQTGRMQTEQLEAIQSILTIKTRSSRGQFLTKWRTQNEVSLKYLRRRMLLQGGVNSIVSILQFSGPMVTLLAGIYLWRNGDISLGKIFSALAISSLLFATANAIYGSVALFLICRTYARRLQDITMSEPAPIGANQVSTLGRIEIDDVRFRYTKNSPEVIKGISLSIEPGETIAIVGRTGSGKSTLAKLMLGLYDADSGRISYDSLPVADIAPASLFSRLAFVPQDVTLETASLHDNITLGRQMSRAEVERACQIACIHEDILNFPSGYDTMINNLGANLSGGQRQRIALARAVLDCPEVLVLDEATSSLDTRTEIDITSNLKAMGCTTIVIAHRLASVVDADVTYVIDDGQIVECGRHRDLMENEGTYRSLFAGQMQAA